MAHRVPFVVADAGQLEPRVLAAVTDSMPREVVGFVSAGPATDADRWPGTDAEIYEFRVAPDRTGQGHGGRLMHAAADTLTQAIKPCRHAGG